MPIRWRLTLWFSLILFGTMVLSGLVLHFVLRSYLSNQIDDSLRLYSAQIHGSLINELPDPLNYDIIHANLPPINEFASPGIYVQLIDKSGIAVVKSDSLGDFELPVNTSLLDQGFAGKESIQTVSAGDNIRMRIMVSPLFLGDEVFLLEVAQSLSHFDSTMSRVTQALVNSSLIALFVAAVSGSMMVRSALSPVRRITRTAKEIEASSDLTRKVNYTGSADEIKDLATTFDGMIEHLRYSFESQKAFVGDASHELRGPLTVIRGNLDLMKRKLSDDDRQECLRAMEAETERMSKIINDLLMLAEVESGQSFQPEPVKLNEILMSELGRASGFGGNRSIFIARQEDLTVSGDAQMIKQLLSNLINNAIRYTPEGGVITLSLFREGNMACLQVADTGIGIAEENLPHIFDRFYRADKARSRARGGVGLGLAIVKEIAEKHGGRVSVTSEPGKGSTFTACLKL